MSKIITLAASQMACSWDIEDNLARAENLVREAHGRGAQVILLQELFETPYFCIEQNFDHQKLATSVDDSRAIQKMSRLAAELEVVLPISWYEKAGPVFYNSLAMIDADGSVMGVYRKSHIPNSIGYQEKEYFCHGDTGFKVWDTRYANIGVGICWDQWFPEAARCMSLAGAELLLYPTAIGSEPGNNSLDSSQHWQNTMCGHAAANIMPLVASNRIGTEVATTDSSLTMDFYGYSFISDCFGNVVEQADKQSECVLTHSFDLDEVRSHRQTWGVYRDRRVDLYGPLLTLDGQQRHPGH
ncbi:MAG: N-carbamoylputrescine amidase [Pseudomonadota bacterium]